MSKKSNKESNAEISLVKLSEIRPSKSNPRKTFNEESLNELAGSIKANGAVLQPILLRPNGKKSGAIYDIVYGHRRFKATQIAGLKTIRAEVRNMNDVEAQEASLLENLHREDVAPMEEAEAMKGLMILKGCTVTELSARFGKSESHVRNHLKLNDLISEIKDMVSGEIMNISVAMVIARYPEEIQTRIYEEHLKEDCTKYDWNDSSAAEMQRQIDNAYSASLACCCFDTKNCKNCPHNTKSQELDLGDNAEAKCLNISCYQEKNTDSIVKQSVELLKESGATDICRPQYGQTNEDAIERLKMMGHEVLSVNVNEIPNPDSEEDEDDDSNEEEDWENEDCEEDSEDGDCDDCECSDDDAEEEEPKQTAKVREYDRIMKAIADGKAQKYVVVGNKKVYLGYCFISSGSDDISKPKTEVEKLVAKDVRNLEIVAEKTTTDIHELFKTAAFEKPWNQEMEEPLCFMFLMENIPNYAQEVFIGKGVHLYQVDYAKRFEIAQSLTPAQKIFIMRQFIVKQFQGTFGSGEKTTLMTDFATFHMPDEVASAEKTHMDVYDKRHSRLQERISIAKSKENNGEEEIFEDAKGESSNEEVSA